MTTGDKVRRPYPGLRSFRRDETDLFFGRESIVDEMVDRLAQSRFLAVLGASGSGKSSLVRTGLLDALELGLLTEAGSHWRVIDFHPGGEPLRNLARGLIGRDASTGEIDQMRAFLQRGPRSVVEWCRDGHMEAGENLLLLVDQFEELFRYQHYEERQEAEAFVGLLLESARSREVPIYVVLTMRSEFLSACALIDGLAEAMNRGQYLTPRMSREQCRMAIEGPAAVCGFKIEPDLVNRLLNDMSDFAPWDESAGTDQSSQLDRMVRRADQLPLLEHALNRLWVRATKAGGEIVLRLNDYLELGGLRGTLHGHLAHILNDLEPKKRKTAEAIFRALTIGTSIADAVRRPTRISELVAISGASLGEVVEVCEAFRSPGRSFLTPPVGTPLRPETVVDISHESLIRQWRDLSTWLEKEAQDTDALRRLDTAAQRSHSAKGDFLSGRELANLAAWVEEAKPSEVWAKRYVKDPSSAFQFLDQSIEHEKGRSNQERRKRAALVFFCFIVPVLGMVIWRIMSVNAQLRDTQDELNNKVAELSITQDDLKKKNEELGTIQRLLAENLNVTVDTVMGFVGGKVDELQRTGNYTKSSNLLAAFVEKTRRGEAKVIPRVLKRFAPRFALQVAASASGMPADEIGVRDNKMSPIHNDSELAAPPTFTLIRAPTSSKITVFDRRTSQTTAVFDFDESMLGELAIANNYLLSPYGRHAVLVGKDGRLFRWSMGERSARRILDKRWLSKSYTVDDEKKVLERMLVSAAFDHSSGNIAVHYREFETDLLTIIGPEQAWSSQSWPLHQISTAVPITPTAAGMLPDESTLPTTLVGILDSEVVLELRARQEDVWVRGLASYDSRTRGVRWLISPMRFLDSQPTTDPNVVHVLLRALNGGCDRSALQAQLTQDPVESLDRASTCVADFNLVSKQLVTTPRLFPRDLQLVIAQEPIDADGSQIRLHTSLRPAWQFSSPLKALRDGTPNIEWWARLPDRMEIVSDSESGFVAMTTISSDLEILDSKQASTGGGESGKMVDLKSYPIPDFSESITTYSVDGAGHSILVASDGKLFAWLVDKRPAQWLQLTPLDADNSCKLQSTQTNVSTPENPAGKLQIKTLAPVSNSRPVFIATREDGKIAFVSITNSTIPAAQVKCLDLTVEEILDTEFEESSVLLRVKNGPASVVAKLQITEKQGYLDVANTSSFDPAVNTDIVQAALLRGGQIVTVDTSGDVAIIAPSINAQSSTASLSAVLPPSGGSYLITTRGSMVLLLREDKASDAESAPRWTSAMVVDFGANEPRVAFAGLLPISFADIKLARIGDQNGLVELLTTGGLFQVRLQAAQAAETLALAIEAIGNASGIDGSERGFVDLGSQALAQTDPNTGNTEARSKGYLQCALAIERAIRAWEKSEDLTKEAGEARLICEGNSEISSTPLAILTLIEQKPSDDGRDPETWPRAASEVLSAAVEGDITALRILLSWGARADTNSLLKDGSNSLLNTLIQGSTNGGRWPMQPMDFLKYLGEESEGADPYGHRALAALTETSTDISVETSIAQSLQHYWLAEILFAKAGATDDANSAASRRVALARSLPLADVASIAKHVLTWAPAAKSRKILPLPSEASQRLRQDLAAIRTLVNRLGPDRSWDLLRLHVLSILAGQADEAVASLARTEIVGTLLAHDDWPSSSGSDASELLRLMDQTAERLSKDPQATTLRLRMIEFLERSDPVLDFYYAENEASPAAVYQRALDKAVEDLTRSSDRGSSLSYVPGRRAFTFSNVKIGNGSQSAAVQKALDTRIKLMELLPKRADIILAKHATGFWRAVSLNDSYASDSSLSPAEKDAERKKYIAYLYQSFTGFKDVLLNGTADNDNLAVAAVSAAWISGKGADIPDFANERDALRAALQRFEYLGALEERGVWLPVFSDVTSNYVTLLVELADIVEREPDEGKIVTNDVYEGLLDDLGYVARADQATARGTVSIQGDRNLEDGDTLTAAYAIAYVAGREAWQARPEAERGACDLEAAAPFDPKRRAPGKWRSAINSSSAVAACEIAVRDNPLDAAAAFQLGRVLDRTSTGILTRSLQYHERAARAGYAPGFNNLAFEADKVDEELGKKLYNAYKSLIIRDSFAEAYKVLKPLTETTGKDGGLRWFAERSATLGSPATNEILANLASDPAERKYRLRLALKYLAVGDPEHNRLQEAVNAIQLADEDEVWINSRVEAWHPEKIPDLPANIVESILEKIPANP